MDCGPPGSSVRGISRQEHWSELPFPSPGDLANSGIEPTSPVLPADSSQCEPPGKPKEDCKKQFMVVAPTRQSLLIWPMSPQGQKSWIFCLAEFLMAPGSLLANASKRFFFLASKLSFFKKVTLSSNFSQMAIYSHNLISRISKVWHLFSPFNLFIL